MTMLFNTSSAEETRRLGERLGKLLIAGDIVLLFGDLGSGKTTLTQGIASGLEVGPDEYVRSPTFAIINQYHGRIPVYHIDLYRMESVADMENLGLEESLHGEGVAVVEWAEKLFNDKSGKIAPDYGLERRIEIQLNILPNDARAIEIKAVNIDKSRRGVFSLQ